MSGQYILIECDYFKCFFYCLIKAAVNFKEADGTHNLHGILA